jgi:hypothetical protein
LSPTVTNCGDGCSYSIDSVTAGGEVVSLVNHTTYDWESGSNMTSIPAVSEESSRNYVLSIANEGSGTTPSVCSFTVEYGGSCHCTDYCSETECSNIETSSGTYNDANTHCIFFTDLDFLNLELNKGATINGVVVTKNKNQCDDNGNSSGPCATFLQNEMNLKTVDGGYYMNLSTTWTFAQLTISGSVPSVCASGN